MKLAPALLALSLVANAALLGAILLRASAPARPQLAPARVAAAQPADTVRRADAVPLGAEFASLTPEQLRDRLRATDLPRNVVEHLLKARIDARVEARTRELMAAAIRSAPPWKLATLTYNRLGILSPAERKEIRDLEADARDATLRLLGGDAADPSGRVAAKYGFVSPEKAVQLEALEADYENLTEQWKDETRNLRTPADKDREKFLKTEKERDLAALLTSAELEAFDLRASPTAKNTAFQARLAAFEPTEAEYRALFVLQKAADAGNPTGTYNAPADPPIAPGSPPVTMAMFMGGSNEPAAADLRAALGDARYADWQLAMQPYYQSLLKLTADNQVPADSAKRLGLTISDTLTASWRIADDLTISGPEKKAALANLANGLRTQLNNTLGVDATESLLKNARWFDSLAGGSAVYVTGNAMMFRNVDPPARPPAPPGK